MRSELLLCIGLLLILIAYVIRAHDRKRRLIGSFALTCTLLSAGYLTFQSFGERGQINEAQRLYMEGVRDAAQRRFASAEEKMLTSLELYREIAGPDSAAAARGLSAL